MARQVMGTGPLLAPEHKVALDPDRWEELARPNVARYVRLANYRASLLREGWSEGDLEGDGSDRLAEAIVLRGDVESVASRLKDHLAAGADHVCVQVLGEDPLDGYAALAAELVG